MVGLEVWLNGRNRETRPAAVAFASAGVASTLAADSAAVFLKANPFRITSMPAGENVGPADEEFSAPVAGSLATAVLRGTSPGVVAWMEDQGRLRLVLKGQSFDVYTLEKVDYAEAVFVRGEERVVKELRYAGASAPLPAARPQPAPTASQAASEQRFAAADPGRNEPGMVSSELVSQLLENPFDEMKKVRIRPSEAGDGLQVQWLNRDSLLGQLGVQKNDVISSINGIPLRNMGDVSNAISSLMNSDRFDLEVARGGDPISLRYVVR
jgi:type II secretory pathway component PulC